MHCRHREPLAVASHRQRYVEGEVPQRVFPRLTCLAVLRLTCGTAPQAAHVAMPQAACRAARQLTR